MMTLNQPIFLVGFPRSGTTYLQSLLATQHRIFTLPETHFYTVLTGHISGSNYRESELEDIRQRCQKMNHFDLRIERGQSRADLFTSCTRQFAEQMNLSWKEGDILLEKTPMHALHVSRILEDFPGARFIHITRHPAEAIRSHYEKLSQGKRDISSLCSDWESVMHVMSELKKKIPHRVYSITYESIQAEPEEELKSLMGFLNLDFSPELLKNYQEEAKKLILKHEAWKAENQGEVYHQEEKQARMTKRQLLELQFLLRKEILAQNYALKNPLWQQLYNWKNA